MKKAVNKLTFKRSEKIYLSYGEQPKNLLDLGQGECKFNIEDTKLFCAGPCKTNSVYCHDHHAVCYKPSSDYKQLDRM